MVTPDAEARSVDLDSVDTSAADKPAALGQPAPEKLEPALTVSEGEAWAALPTLFYKFLEDTLPELKPVYTPERCKDWGDAMVPLAKKYGWTPDGALAWLGPWALFVLASHRLVTPTAKAIAARIQAARAEALKEQQPAQPAA